ncbi:MAG TPA: hypothetical protein PLL78_03390 [Fimbriimonadaceae bacterium]|nr:hypothetical protein [Fimbriimonadaceae bacterium]HRJ95704.1 hypothetical protein [Fimbriimonadaceae bacterium]
MKQVGLIVSGTCGLAIATGWTATGWQTTLATTGQPAGLDAHESHASASLLGQFRTTFSGWLWLRTDLYLHNGVEMRRLTEQEVAGDHRGSSSIDNHDHALHDDSLITTVIPSAEQDFRGIFGDIERATSAYKDMTQHTHNDPVSALPLFRLMTWVDPSFLPGWTTGAAIIARDRSDRSLEKALGLLREGLAKNPRSIALDGEIGYLLAARRRDFRQAVHHLDRARIQSLERAALSDDEFEALPQIYRWLSLSYRERGMLAEMYAVLREGVERFPEDAVLQRLLESPPTPLLDSAGVDPPARR